MTTPRSGEQVTIEHGEQHAVVVTTGAAIREFRVGDRDVFVPFGEDEVSPAFHGGVLAPWPNRLADGRYTFEGEPLQVPITEPSRMTALHGLVAWSRWDVADRGADHVTLATTIPAHVGYPFTVALRVTYRLDDDGLSVEAVATNEGSSVAPYGIGFHPWLSPGAASVDECTLQVGATTLVTTDDRLLPTGTVPATGDNAVHHGLPLRGLEFDTAFVDVVRDDAGLSWSRLTSADGASVVVWMDGSCHSWQVCTGDGLHVEAYRRVGVAVEPMTCIADAFRTGDHLVRLQPGASHTTRWGAGLVRPGQ